jgi:hypothetical protein
MSAPALESTSLSLPSRVMKVASALAVPADEAADGAVL